MSRRIVVAVDPYEARAALLEGDRLINVEIENAAVGKRKGNVYRGRVTAVEPSLDAAFVDYGAGKDGFLPFDEVANRSLTDLTGHSRANNRSGLNSGDWVLVQVTKEEVGKKGASLTMHVSLPGRFVVLMPFSDRTGVSRRLGGEERTRLKQIAQQLVLPEGFGCIVRTVGEDEQVAEIQGDLEHLLRAWYEIVDRFKAAKGTAEVHAESGLALRFVRDYMSNDVTEVLVEDDASFTELTRFVESRMPQRKGLVKRYTGELPLFVRYGVERQIDALLDNRVVLPSGGSIVIGQTEALVAIDVNSGRQKQRDIEDTAFKVNIEAARELARQCVLRDLGGIIVVDFIDMENEGHRRAVEDELKAAFAIDKARLTFTKIQEFGLLCFSRQRIRQAVDSGVTLPCPACSGSGRVRSPALLAMSALRKIRERLAMQGQRAAYLEVTVPVEVANFLNNRKREALAGLESRHEVMIDILGDSDALPDDIRVTVLGEVPSERATRRQPAESGATGPSTGRAPAPVRSAIRAPEAAPALPPAAAQVVVPSRMPDNVPVATRSPGRERSFFRGLISRFLGLEELEEVPATPQAPQRLPAPPVPPAPPPAVEPPPAPRPVQSRQAAADRSRAQAPQRSRPPAPQVARGSSGGSRPAPAQGAAPAAARQAPVKSVVPAEAAKPAVPAEPVKPAGTPSGSPAANVPVPASGSSDGLTKSAKRRRRRRRNLEQASVGGAAAIDQTPDAPPESAPKPSPTPSVTSPAEVVAADAPAAESPKKRTRSRSRKPKAPVASLPQEGVNAAPSGNELPAPPVPAPRIEPPAPPVSPAPPVVPVPPAPPAKDVAEQPTPRKPRTPRPRKPKVTTTTAESATAPTEPTKE